MYICEECGFIFEEEQKAEWYEERGEYFGTPVSEAWSGCPHCHGSYREIEPCKACGEYKYIEEGEDFCEECKENIERRFNELLEKEFTEEERELLNELYGV